ncbi:MAG: radical SAM protein [Myxococcales bacterium]|nr:radical SAM protein [Myxococcales bacterium]
MAKPVEILQINIGKKCNQACQHCHVEAGPNRTEMMSDQTVSRVMELMSNSPDLRTLDITGGAPELHPRFRDLVKHARTLQLNVIDRCNLTVLFEEGQEDTAQFLRDHEVEVVASLPCYSSKNVDQQRGKGVFGTSIEALRLLNTLGYGETGGCLKLNLVYNPVGAHLPPAQGPLEADYKQRLWDDFGIVFNTLFTITNMPIKRFAHQLNRDGHWDTYMSLLNDNFNPSTVDGLMCTQQISVGYDGNFYDCDFNQMLEVPIRDHKEKNIWQIQSLQDLEQRPIQVAGHCLGCTAGAGSSCGGALV